jgi:hypothetical protein
MKYEAFTTIDTYHTETFSTRDFQPQLGWRKIVDKETQAAILEEIKRISWNISPARGCGALADHAPGTAPSLFFPPRAATRRGQIKTREKIRKGLLVHLVEAGLREPER